MGCYSSKTFRSKKHIKTHEPCHIPQKTIEASFNILQNNLNELWSVFDFVQPRIFGSYPKFTKSFTDIIQKGLLADASNPEKRRSDQLSKELRGMY